MGTFLAGSAAVESSAAAGYKAKALALDAGTSTTVPLLAGDAGTAQTIDLMRRAWRDALASPLIRLTAGRLVRALDPGDRTGQARAIFEFVRRQVRFVRDPVGQETVSAPEWTLRAGFGDCDDIALLTAALCGAAGVTARLVTVAADPRDPEAFSHVYAEAFVHSHWIPLDSARPGARFGAAARNYSRKRAWFLHDDTQQDLGRGLSGLALDLGEVNWGEIINNSANAAIRVISAVRQPAYTLPPSATIYSPSTGRPVANMNYPGQTDWTPWLIGGGLLIGGLMLFTRKG